ncbi:MAG: mechanosensitive ion channel family protein [Vicinamibacterales bacterium]
MRVLPVFSLPVWAQSTTTSSWIGRRIPAVLQTAGPWGLAWWQWLALPVLALVAIAAGRALGAVTRTLLQRVSRGAPGAADERWLRDVAPALTALWAVGTFRLLLPWLDLPAGQLGVVTSLVGAAAVVAVFWLLWRSIDTLVFLVLQRSWASDDAAARSTIIVVGNLLKAGVAVTGAVTTAATFGYPVATVVAGLGIGGIAFAFGAQKTVEHLFGSIALAADQPCRVGDLVKVDEIVGQVEYIGARSTRLRTFDRTVVTIPNGRLADSRIESYAARDRLRLATVVPVAYGATEAQLRQLVAGIDALLRAHPLVWRESIVARLANVGAGALDIEIVCWFETTDFDVFRGARQDILLGTLGLAEAAGVTLARWPPAPTVAPAPAQA